MNTHKIKRIVELLNELDEHDQKDINDEELFSEEKFAERFNERIGKPVLHTTDKEKDIGNFIRHSKVLVPVISLVLFFVCSNYITVRATNVNVLQYIGSKISTIYFSVARNHQYTDNQDPPAIEMSSMKEIDSFAEAEKWLDVQFLEIANLPDDYYNTGIQMTKAKESYIFTIKYLEDTTNSFITLSLYAFDDSGQFAYSIESLDKVTEEITINDLQVIIYNTDDATHASFEYGEVLYNIKTNLGHDVLVNLISEMR